MVQSETPRRAALVTGGARGIGRAACLALAAEGMDIAVNYAGSAAAAEQTAADCRALGVQAVALQADVRMQPPPSGGWMCWSTMRASPPTNCCCR